MADDYNPFAPYGLGEGTPQYGPTPARSPFSRFSTEGAGLIGSGLNFLFGPTQFAVNTQRQQNEAAAAARIQAALSQRVTEQGMTPAAAMMDFLKTPEGVEAFSQDIGTLNKGVQEFVKTMSPTRSNMSPGQTMVEHDPMKKDPRIVAQSDDWVAEDILDPVLGSNRRQYRNRATGEVSQTPRGNTVNITPAPGATPGAPAAQPGAPLDIERAKEAITGIETPGSKAPYSERQVKTGALGRYQVMPANVPQWTEEAGVGRMTPEQFAASPTAQERVFEHRFPLLVKQFGSPERAALAWFAGPKGTPASRDYLGTTGQDYMDRFSRVYYRQQAQAPGAPGAPAKNVQPAQQPGKPGAPGIPTGPQPAQTFTKDPGANSTGQTPPVIPAEEMTSWQSVQNAYGIAPGLISSFASFAGQVIPETQRAPIVKQIQLNRQRLALDVEDAIRIYVNSLPGMQDGTRAQAEMERIRKAMDLDPRFWKSEQDGYNALLNLDERLRIHLARAERNSQASGKLPVKAIQEALVQASTLRDTIARLGVPPPGDPKRDNPPTTGAWDLLKRLGEQEAPVVQKGVKEMQQDKPMDPQEAFDGLMKDVDAGKLPQQNDPRVQALMGARRADLLRKLGERNQELIRSRRGQ